ncbi:MAG TPA: hypothetical protein VFR58_14240 [Flavisolibacter sp.]|nr:hypothetical protein [Flavisolibacter sp.]
MNLLRRLVESTSIRLSTLSPRQIRFDISRQDWVNFGLVLLISFMIIVYKTNRLGS